MRPGCLGQTGVNAELRAFARADSRTTGARAVPVRIPMKADTDSDNCRTPIPAQIGQSSERSDADGPVMQKCPE